MWAMSIHAFELSIDFSQSLAILRQRLSHAKVRSTTHLRGMTSKLFCGIRPLHDLDSPVAEIGQKRHAALSLSNHQPQKYAATPNGNDGWFGRLQVHRPGPEFRRLDAVSQTVLSICF